jgi:hypothetical protein
MDVIAQTFEVGQNPNGLASLESWINTQLDTAAANRILYILSYDDEDQNYLVVVMSTLLTTAKGQTLGSNVSAAQFDVRNGLSALLTWINAEAAGLTSPSSFTTSTEAGGTLTGQGTLGVRISLSSPYGETAASPEQTQTVADDNYLVVAAPLNPAAAAIGWNVYVGAVGAEQKQNAYPLPFTASWVQTLPASATTLGALPTTNTSGLGFVQNFSMIERGDRKLITVVLGS